MDLTIPEIIEGIDNLALYKKDYDMIEKLLSLGDYKLFTKIVEEVIMGNLFWSDFDKMLANTNYPTLLEDTLAQQKLIQDEMSKLLKFRSKINETTVLHDNKTTALALAYADPEIYEQDAELYSEEYQDIKDNLLYELTKPSASDNELVIACKIKLENAIRNGELLIKRIGDDLFKDNDLYKYDEKFIYKYSVANISGFDPDTSYYLKSGSDYIEVNKTTFSKDVAYYTLENGTYIQADIEDFDLHDDTTYYTYNGSQYTAVNKSSYSASNTYYVREEYDYINPDDIFFFISTYNIPLSYKHQTLNDFDKAYMLENNLTEEQMKQFKSLSAMLRRDNFYSK